MVKYTAFVANKISQPVGLMGKYLTAVSKLAIVFSCLIWSVAASASTEYIGTKGEQFAESYKTTTTSSGVSCGFVCSTDEKCNAFNYQESSETCELVVRTNGSKLNSLEGWKAYRAKSSTTERCSDGWQTFQESCYFIGPNSVTFANAQVYCLSRGAHVVHVDNGLENQFLKNYLAQLKDNSYWNGLSHEQINGVWRWTDDNNLVTFFDWGPGEPSNSNGAEACVVYAWKMQLQWNDDKCLASARPICEKNSTTDN